ncbi:MAG: 1-acyl-sn-glycerol-3-phosphate acyltransferase [Bdellovibrionales bacterium]|nr:1-acyl-sn-glycerol-3-phosphate acyltransferase [Bdellovibrionales bacterium]
MSKIFLLISGVKFIIHGRENIDYQKTYIVTFNHFNFFDHFFLYHVLKLKLTGLEKEQHMKIPLYAQFMKIAGIIPIPQRGNTEKALKGLETAKQRMKQEGYSILIAPEGTRCRDGRLGSFKKGAFYMAVQTQSDILPVVFDKNMYRFNKRGQFLLTPCEVHVSILPSISTQGMNETHISSLKDQVYTMYTDQVGESYISG